MSGSVEGAPFTYKFDVSMMCGGCSNAVNKVLKRLEENETQVKSYTVLLDIEKDIHEANVTTDDESPLLYQKILQTIKKTGKAVNSCVEFDKNGNKVRDMPVKDE
ncbi:hypothetical protein B0H65DRAFT_548590 [Neurospora tetraspora]|uniref:HMA domain-containing protein n=1 Tax=Neurospora tetraspora TaxID=94610 RepID=A0AAE0MRP6_9PEZI|nr:hypothetical protein B0H65DRAFT_548590 [Neurospora tetraspora]